MFQNIKIPQYRHVQKLARMKHVGDRKINILQSDRAE